MATIGKYGKVVFMNEEIQFIKDNFRKMTNQELADYLNVKKTVLRTTAYNLGLQRMVLELWSEEQVQYLKDNYKTMGNTELMKYYNRVWPKNKKWQKNSFSKKLNQLGLSRTVQDLYVIWENHRQNGSFGGINQNKQLKPMPKIFISVDDKTKIEVKYGQNPDEVVIRYNKNREIQKSLLLKR